MSKEEYREIEKAEFKKIMNESIAQRRESRKSNISNDLDKEIYGFSNKKEYISEAFPPKVKICDNSIYEKTPVFWKGNRIPNIVVEKNLTYIIRFKACFKIKKGKMPFVMNKISL